MEAVAPSGCDTYNCVADASLKALYSILQLLSSDSFLLNQCGAFSADDASMSETSLRNSFDTDPFPPYPSQPRAHPRIHAMLAASTSPSTLSARSRSRCTASAWSISPASTPRRSSEPTGRCTRRPCNRSFASRWICPPRRPGTQKRPSTTLTYGCSFGGTRGAAWRSCSPPPIATEKCWKAGVQKWGEECHRLGAKGAETVKRGWVAGRRTLSLLDRPNGRESRTVLVNTSGEKPPCCGDAYGNIVVFL